MDTQGVRAHIRWKFPQYYGDPPSIPAVMRSYAIGALRLLNFTNIAEGTRGVLDDFGNPLIALGLTM